MTTAVKIEFYVPVTHLEQVKTAIFATGAGKIGNYDCCCWQIPGTGQFRPLKNSSPYIGQQGELESVEEYKVELICNPSLIDQAILALKKAHPYETPAYQYWTVHL